MLRLCVPQELRPDDFACVHFPVCEWGQVRRSYVAVTVHPRCVRALNILFILSLCSSWIYFFLKIDTTRVKEEEGNNTEGYQRAYCTEGHQWAYCL